MRKFIPLLFALAFAIFGRVFGDGCNGCGDCDDVTHVTLVVTKEVISPACNPRTSLVINGTLPGPQLDFHAGQHVHIRVWNLVDDSNITMHWHGISQYGSPFSDGTPQASQWPIPPGKYFDYEFKFDLNVSGTFWYHSHVGFTLLSAHGALILHQADNSPVDSNCPIPYDEERVFMVEDFFYLDEEALIAEAAKGQFVGAANIRLINGQNYATCNQTVLTQFNDTNTCDNKCSYAALDIEPDKTYLFRFIGATIDTFAGIAIEDHNLTIVQIDGGSWIEPYDTNYIEMHSGQRYACILKAKTREELEKSGQLTYVAQVIDYQNPPPGGPGGPGGGPGGGNGTGPGGPPGAAGNTTTGGPGGAGNTTAGGPGGGPPGGFVAPPPIPPTFAILTYQYPGCGKVNPSVYTTVPANSSLPTSFPNFTEGPKYGLITDTFKPIHPLVPPPADLRVYLTTSQDSWSGKERDVMNGMAYQPDPDYVPLLVGMYNGEITVDQVVINRAAANNGFDNATGAIVIGKTTVVEFVIKNQIGTLGLSVPHPFHLHGGDFWDMGGGSGEFTDEAFEAHLATMTPCRRDTTILGAIPGNGTLDTPEGWRVMRWQPLNPGVWMLHCHITGHMMMGLQTQIVVGTNEDLPPLPADYQGAYLSKGQVLAMGTNESDFIPYFITQQYPNEVAGSPPPRRRNRVRW